MSYTSHDLLDAARRAIPEVSVEAVAARRTRGDEVVLLDVREKDEVRTGYIEGAVTIPRGLLEFQAAAHLPQTDMDVVVYCASGARSLLAAQVLRAMGYTHVASMAGGITRWQEAVPGRARPATQCGAAGALQPPFPATPAGKRARANCSTPKCYWSGLGDLLPGGVVPGRGGVGTLGIVDADVVDRSNLQRQVLHRPAWVCPKPPQPPWRSTHSIRMSRCAYIPSVSRWTTSWRSSRDYDVIVDGSTISPRATW